MLAGALPQRRHPGERLVSSGWQEGGAQRWGRRYDVHCPGTGDRPALVAHHHDRASGLAPTASWANLLKTDPGPNMATLIWGGPRCWPPG